jgi:hypothetical protein
MYVSDDTTPEKQISLFHSSSQGNEQGKRGGKIPWAAVWNSLCGNSAIPLNDIAIPLLARGAAGALIDRRVNAAFVCVLQQEPQKMTNSASIGLDERGRQLGRDIQELYSNLDRSKSLKAKPFINDISDFMRKHFPEGMSFEDAEEILQSAGFYIVQRSGNDVPPR